MAEYTSQTSTRCDICLWHDKDDILYGDWMSSEDVNVHYFCLLSAGDIVQKGHDKNELLGFRPKDIVASFKKYRKRECYCCGQKSAAVKCADQSCDRFFHYPCGTRNSCMTNFSGRFESYCSRHVPDRNGGKTHGTVYCLACLELIASYRPADSIISSCCLRSDEWAEKFVHKKCVTQYVKNAGYDSMCINCDMEGLTKEQWQAEMRLKGIFVPMTDAIWEKDGSFNDHVKNKCGLMGCLDPSNTRTVWTCFVCGCLPRHLKCARVNTPEEYHCAKCFDQSFVDRVPLS